MTWSALVGWLNLFDAAREALARESHLLAVAV